MAGANEDDQIKLLVIYNKSNAQITLYIYLGWAPFCKISTISKIIKPNQRYPYHEETLFKFEICAKSSDDEKERNLLGPVEWNGDKLITITESLECQQENLTRIENGRQLYLREIHREEELASANLYDTLGLDMEEIRRMNNADLKRAIERAFRRQMLIWHPDRNFGDVATAVLIILAKEILLDDEKRARYHNEVDYDKGWFSRKRWKAIFWSECSTEEQKKAYRRRICMCLASLGLAVGGIVFSLVTAGAAAPALVICGAVFGGGLTGAGFQSLGHTTTRKSVVDGCDVKSWFLKAGIGFVGGAVTGGAGVGITAGIVGIGSAAIWSGAVTAGQYVAMGAATGAVGGFVLSLSSDFAKRFVDKEKVTWSQAVFRAFCGSVISAGAGALGGLVTKGIVDSRASAATSTLEGDAVEQVSALTGGKRVGNAVAHVVSKQVTITGAKGLLGIPSKIAEERLDDSVENQKVTKHVENGLKDTALEVLRTATLNTAGASITSGIEEAKLNKQSSSRNTATSKEANSNEANSNGANSNGANSNGANSNEANSNGANSNGANSNEAHGKNQGQENERNEDQGAGEPNHKTNGKQVLRQSKEIRSSRQLVVAKEMNKQNEPDNSGNQSNNANVNKSGSGRSDTTSEREAPEPEDQSYEGHCGSTQQNLHVDSEKSRANQSSNGESCEENLESLEMLLLFCCFICMVYLQVFIDEINKKHEEPLEVMIKYRSKGTWVSKMIVTWYLNGEKNKKEVSGDGKRVYISADATDIEVRFQVFHPGWGDIMKYDRFKKTWYEPYRPHIFRYEKAVDRTFTLSGPLWWEAVTRVSDEHHEETHEMTGTKVTVVKKRGRKRRQKLSGTVRKLSEQ